MSEITTTGPKVALVRAKPLHPSKMDIETLQANAGNALGTLAGLLEDASLSELIRKKVGRIVTKLNPNREGYETDSTGVWKIPNMLVNQFTTTHKSKPDNAKPGDLFTTSGLLISRPFKYYVLYMYERNILFEQGEDRPKCSSPDGKLGSPFGFCEKCQFLPINKQKGAWASRTKTNCANVLDALVIDASFNDMYLLSFSKTSRTAGSALHDILNASDNIFDREFQLDTELKNTESGKYYVLKATPTGVLLNPERMKDGHRDDEPSPNELVASSLVSLFKAYREVQIHKHYNGAAGGTEAAERMEENFDPSKHVDGSGEEPTFDGVSDSARSNVKPM